MRVVVVSFLQSNQADSLLDALRRLEIDPVLYQGTLVEAAGFILLGGEIAQDALRHLMREIKTQSGLGKPVLGLGKGAQWLVESGIVPGVEDFLPVISLSSSNEALSSHIRLSEQYQRNAFTSCLSAKDLLPVLYATPALRYVVPPALWHEVKLQGLNVLEYSDGGSMAGLSNKAGNVLALLPTLSNPNDLDKILISMRAYMGNPERQKLAALAQPLDYYPR